MNEAEQNAGIQSLQNFLTLMEALTPRLQEVFQERIVENKELLDKSKKKLLKLSTRDQISKERQAAIDEFKYHDERLPLLYKGLSDWRERLFQAKLKQAEELNAEQPTGAEVDDFAAVLQRWKQAMGSADDIYIVAFPSLCHIAFASYLNYALAKFCIPDYVEIDYEMQVSSLSLETIKQGCETLVKTDGDLTKALAVLFSQGNIELAANLFTFIRTYAFTDVFISDDDERERCVLKGLAGDLSRSHDFLHIALEKFSSI